MSDHDLLVARDQWERTAQKMIGENNRLTDALLRWAKRRCERDTLGVPCGEKSLCDACHARRALWGET